MYVCIDMVFDLFCQQVYRRSMYENLTNRAINAHSRREKNARVQRDR